MRLTQKLLGFLHRVFDRDPHQFLALRLNYDGEMTWRVADGVLTTAVTGGSGGDLQIDLAGFTLRTLIDHLAQQPGYSLAYGTSLPEQLSLSARVLIDMEGDPAMSNGDHLHAYESLLYAYLDPVAVELKAARTQIDEMLAQMSTKTADAEWLDEWGGYFGVGRQVGEVDVNYARRIVAEVLRPRGNNIAMAAAISEAIGGQPVSVTDVRVWGATFPLHNSVISHNGVELYNASALPVYGLFDVEYDYDLENGPDMAAFADFVRGYVNTLRDAGTHMRALLLRSSGLSDTLTSPPTDGEQTIALAMVGAYDDTAVAPEDGELAMASTLSPLADAHPGAEAEAMNVSITYTTTYDGLRLYNGKATHTGGMVIAESL